MIASPVPWPKPLTMLTCWRSRSRPAVDPLTASCSTMSRSRRRRRVARYACVHRHVATAGRVPLRRSRSRRHRQPRTERSRQCGLQRATVTAASPAWIHRPTRWRRRSHLRCCRPRARLHPLRPARIPHSRPARSPSRRCRTRYSSLSHVAVTAPSPPPFAVAIACGARVRGRSACNGIRDALRAAAVRDAGARRRASTRILGEEDLLPRSCRWPLATDG